MLETEMALATEVAPNADGQKHKDNNVELVRQSDGLLPTSTSDILRSITLIASHTTCALRNVYDEHGKCCGSTEHVSVDGVISRQRVEEAPPSLKAAIDQGLKYTIMTWQLAERRPRVLSLLCESDNAKHDMHRPETWLQTLLHIHARAKMSASERPDWEEVGRRAALASNGCKSSEMGGHDCKYVA